MEDMSSPLIERGTDDQMARARNQTFDRDRVQALVVRLQAAFDDAAAFRSVLDEIEQDKSLSARDVSEVATAVTKGARFKTRAAALVAIGQERQRRVHAKAKAASAAKTKTW